MELLLLPAPKEGANFLTLDNIRGCDGATLALDTETSGLYWWRDRVIGIGIYCPSRGIKGYFPISYSDDMNSAVEVIRGWGKGTTVICHNLKFDFHMLGIDPAHVDFRIMDTTVLVHLMDPRNRKDLETSSLKYLKGSAKKTFIYKIKGKKAKIWDWPTALIAEYCANDCVQTFDLAKLLYPEIKKQGMGNLFNYQMRYLGRIWEIERFGMKIDPVYIEKAMRALEGNVRVMEEDLYRESGSTFNWRSPQQLSHAIFDGMGIPKPVSHLGNTVKFKTHYTATSTSSFILMEQAHHPLGSLIMALRETSKLVKTLQLWLSLADDNNHVHPNFNLTGTRTGRLSSSKPNSQNLPGEFRTRETQNAYSGASGDTRGEDYNLRQAFIPEEGYTLASIDYKQMEIRVFGVLSGDENMLAALRSGADVHGMIAKQIWGSPDPVHREWAKTVSFGLLYGLTMVSLQFKLGVTEEEAQHITESYWKAFPRVKPFMRELIRRCEQTGFVTYWSGRRWYEDVPLFMFKAVNAMVQGGSHDMYMVGVCRIADFIEREYPDVKIFNLVHDEIDFHIPDALVEEVLTRVAPIMEVPDLFGIGFPTDCKVGKTYGQLHSWPPKEGEKAPDPKEELKEIPDPDLEDEEEEPEPEVIPIHQNLADPRKEEQPMPIASQPYSIFLPEENGRGK